MRIAIIVISLLLNACASKQISECPGVVEEPVSVCRAQAACGIGSTRIFIAVALGAGEQVNYCVDRHLNAQRSSIGLASNSTTCRSVLYTDNTIRTVCE